MKIQRDLAAGLAGLAIGSVSGYSAAPRPPEPPPRPVVDNAIAAGWRCAVEDGVTVCHPGLPDAATDGR